MSIFPLQPGFTPGAATPAKAGPGKFPQAPKKSAPRVLVVDDDPLVRWALAQALGARGYELVEADDAESALDSIRGATPPPALILLDVRLPDCLDLQLLALIRRAVPAVPVLVVTAFATPELCAEARQLGACAVVEKPFDLDPLIAQVTRLVTAPNN